MNYFVFLSFTVPSINALRRPVKRHSFYSITLCCRICLPLCTSKLLITIVIDLTIDGELHRGRIQITLERVHMLMWVNDNLNSGERVVLHSFCTLVCGALQYKKNIPCLSEVSKYKRATDKTRGSLKENRESGVDFPDADLCSPPSLIVSSLRPRLKVVIGEGRSRHCPS